MIVGKRPITSVEDQTRCGNRFTVAWLRWLAVSDRYVQLQGESDQLYLTGQTSSLTRTYPIYFRLFILLVFSPSWYNAKWPNDDSLELGNKAWRNSPQCSQRLSHMALNIVRLKQQKERFLLRCPNASRYGCYVYMYMPIYVEKLRCSSELDGTSTFSISCISARRLANIIIFQRKLPQPTKEGMCFYEHSPS